MLATPHGDCDVVDILMRIPIAWVVLSLTVKLDYPTWQHNCGCVGLQHQSHFHVPLDDIDDIDPATSELLNPHWIDRSFHRSRKVLKA
jgi:hypothetical protein